ncbi:Flp pilus assembly protein CpaB [Blastococcus tunisiensis]|uniref:Flp pilus assembly protein CpaB n=1 Tax=Blastococcus tunisiensis TaxID=1798228 RepID=A0A1I1YAR9_9ACTN|nr:Flp pilus assembly protein CpaB [Blastococcus sp. DSM 46838]SFE16656.1 Flp pilus assembly protein CpaB [Blastococcus sp. DSM 46838]
MTRIPRPRFPVHTARRTGAGMLVVLALVLAVRPDPSPAAPQVRAELPVAVAAADLPAGAVLVAADLAAARFPPELRPAGGTADPAELVGRVLAGAVRAGEPVTDVRLVGRGLTALLPEGQVAAPVRLADLAVAALVNTGDRVDVLATAPDSGTAEVIAAAALVLATPGDGADGQDTAAGLLLLAVDGPTAARLAAMATAATLTISLPPP